MDGRYDTSSAAYQALAAVHDALAALGYHATVGSYVVNDDPAAQRQVRAATELGQRGLIDLERLLLRDPDADWHPTPPYAAGHLDAIRARVDTAVEVV